MDILIWAVILTVTCLIGFVLGGAFERARCEAASIARFEEMEDARIFDPMSDPVMVEAYRLMPQRPHLKLAPQPGVDAHFDNLAKLGLIESMT